MITKQITHINEFRDDGSVYFFNKEISNLIISAAKGEYQVFNESNIRQVAIDNLPYFIAVKIQGDEYIIKGELNDKGELNSLSIYNYQFIEKWLVRHSYVLQNHRINIEFDIGKYIKEKALDLNIENYDKLYDFLEKLFLVAIKYHRPSNFDPVWSGINSEEQVLNSYSGLWSWFQNIQKEFIESKNGFIKELRSLFHKLHPHIFFALRDFIIDLNHDIIGELGNQGFYFGNTPFKSDIIHLDKTILKNHPDEKIKLKLNTLKSFEEKGKTDKEKYDNTKLIRSKKSYSIPKPIKKNISKPKLLMKQIALKYIYEGKVISRDNADKIAREYKYTSKTSGESLYQDYTKLSPVKNRIGDEGTKRKNRNKANLIRSVIEYLPRDKKNSPNSDITALEEIIEKMY